MGITSGSHPGTSKKKGSVTSIKQYLLRQDNVPTPLSATTKLELTVMGLECMLHLQYLQDVAPMDALRGHLFESQLALKVWISQASHKLSEDWYKSVHKNWVVRHEKYFKESDEYFEKLLKSHY